MVERANSAKPPPLRLSIGPDDNCFVIENKARRLVRYYSDAVRLIPEPGAINSGAPAKPPAPESSIMSAAPPRLFILFLITAGSALGLAGTDLVLPAIPTLPEKLGGTQAMAQYVLASYVAGVACGLILFGELGARFRQGWILTASLALFGLTSIAGAYVTAMEPLIGLRFFQGLFGSASAVFAPVWIRALFDAPGAMRAMGALGSIESLTPALAPVIGLWIITWGGWQAPFSIVGVLALCVALAISLYAQRVPSPQPSGRAQSYLSLFANIPFIRHGVSQALTLAGLLVFVFGAPAVFTKAVGRPLTDFVAMQVIGIGLFIIAANSASRIARRIGLEQLILIGAAMTAIGTLAELMYALAGGRSTFVIGAIFVVVNVGLGLRGPTGFFAALGAAEGNESRAAAIVLVATFLVVGLGTAIAAPFVATGLVELAAVSLAISAASPALLLALKPKANAVQT